MVQVGNGPGFAREALQRLQVVEIASLNGFDRDELPVVTMPREIDRRRSALSQLSDELLAGFQCAQICREVLLWMHPARH
jgi:hypothetical protein